MRESKTKTVCTCRPIFSRFCDDPPDFDGIEFCPLHAAAPALRDALRKLLQKIEAMQEPLKNMCVLAGVHGMPYNGPKWAKELAVARAALALCEPPEEEQGDHKEHPSGGYCMFCLSQWPCEEAPRG